MINSDKSNKIVTINYAEATTSTDQNSNLRNRINIENAKSPRTKAKSKEIIKKSYFDFDPNNLDAVSAKNWVSQSMHIGIYRIIFQKVDE